MPSRRNSTHRQTMRVTFCSMVTALSVMLMLSGGLIPVMTYVAPLAAGVLLLAVLVEYGRKYAWITWLATALCTLMLDADKEAALFYLFLGYYPILKWRMERIAQKRLKMLCKAAFFIVTTLGMYAGLLLLFPLGAAAAEFQEMGRVLTAAFFLMMILCLFLYDRLLVIAVILYDKKIRPKLRFIRSGN